MTENVDSADSSDASQSPAKPGKPQPPDASLSPDTSIPSIIARQIDESVLDLSIHPPSGKPPKPQDTTLVLAQTDGIPNDDNVPDDPKKLRPGQMVFGYIIEENPNKASEKTYIGDGASGVVYRARHLGLDRPVALKFLKRTGASPEELEQFSTEARSIAKLQGRNILQVYDFSEWNRNMFIAMELLEGGSAKSRMEKQFGVPTSSGLWKNITKIVKKEEVPAEKPIEYIVSHADIEYFANTMIQVAEQLEIAHQNGILHRDIKPGNIMYRDLEQKEARLVDYGLAALIKDETTIPGGTPGFMALEQISSEPIDARTDVFGLGATLYNLLTAKSVHNLKGNENISEIIGKILNSVPTNIRLLNKKVDRNLAAIVHKAIAKKPEKRYESARAFYEDLKRWKEGRYVTASPVTSFFIPTARRLKKRGLQWLTTAAVSGALVGLATSLYNAKEPERMRNVRVENYIADIKTSVSAADALRESANKSYEILRKKSLIETLHGNVDIAALSGHQKTITSVFDGYHTALKLAEEWKKDDISTEKTSEEKRRELDVLVKEFERKKDYAVQKVTAYEKILEFMESYKEKDFAKAEKALALALDRLYEIDTQKELIRVQEEYSMYQKQRTMQGVRDIAVRVRAYRRVCRACFMDEIDIFSGNENDIAPEKGSEWKKMITGIEKILETPDDDILRKIPLDVKTHADLREQAKADAQEAFYSEQSILKNKDVKRAVDMKRNRVAEDRYIAELSEKYKSGKLEEDEFRVLMRLPLPSEREKFMQELDNGFKKGTIPERVYEKLRSGK